MTILDCFAFIGLLFVLTFVISAAWHLAKNIYSK